MPTVPFDPRVNTTPINSQGNVKTPDFKVDNSAMIHAQNSMNQSRQVANISGQIMNGIKEYQQGVVNSDLENARRLTMDLDTERKSRMLKAKTAQEIADINKEFSGRAQDLLSGSDQNGVPYFRSQEGRQMFDSRMLSGQVKKWNDESIYKAHELESRESSKRINLSVNSVIEKDYQSPEAEQRIRELYSSLPNKTPAEVEAHVKTALTDLDKQRVFQDASQFETEVEQVLASQDFTPTGKRKLINEQIATYSEKIDKLKSFTPAEKKAYKDRLQSSLKQVDAMVKDDRAQQVKAFKLYQEKNEADLITQVAQKTADGTGMPYREMLDLINKNPDAFDQSFKEKILAGVYEANEKQAKRIEQEKEDFTKGVFDVGKVMAQETQKNFDLKTMNKVLDFDGSHDEWREVFLDVMKMDDTKLSSSAKSMIMEKNPANVKPGAVKDDSALFSKQLDNILGFGYTKEQKEKATIEVNWGFDKDRFTTDDNGFEVFDGLSENKRFEIKHKLLKDYQRIYKEVGPEKAETYITAKMSELKKSTDDRKFYLDYVDTRLDINKPEQTNKSERIMHNPQTGEKIILKNGQWVKYGE